MSIQELFEHKAREYAKKHKKVVAGAKENESEIEILQKQKSKLIDMVKQLMSYELPKFPIDNHNITIYIISQGFY